MVFDVFRTPPASLSPLQRRIVLITSIVVALTRLPAISATLGESDEALFILGVREYDVTLHFPHPPGFPVYLALAKFVAWFSVDEFRALQTVVVIAAMGLFPLMFFLGRELRFGFRTSFLGAMLFVFFPNVWYFGGTAYSDIPGLALVLSACVLLIRGCRDVRAYYAGAIVLGLAAGIRPQSLLIGLAPALVASWFQLRRIAIAALLGATVIAASYGGAMLASESPRRYFATLRGLRVYLHDVDSIANPTRLPLAHVADSIFMRPMQSGRLPLVVLMLVLTGVAMSFVKRHAGAWLLLATFLPFALFALFMLDPYSISRYAMAWLPMYALLAAYGIAWIPFVDVVLIVSIAARFAWWTWPAITEARTTPSPPVAALAWAAQHRGTIYYDGVLRPFTLVLLPHARLVQLGDFHALPIVTNRDDVWVFEGLIDSLDARVFRRDRTRLAQIVRPRYLTISAAPASSVPIFGDGWWDEEFGESDRWRWMGRRSDTLLAAVGPKARLTLRAACATKSQTVDVTLNRARVATFACSDAVVTREWIVNARTGVRNELTLTTNRVVNPARDLRERDTRDLGMRIEGIGWKAAP